MRLAVNDADGGTHVDDSFNQFGFFDLGHGSIAALKFGAGEAIAIFQRGELNQSFGRHDGNPLTVWILICLRVHLAVGGVKTEG
jgi:hypothetical protein